MIFLDQSGDFRNTLVEADSETTFHHIIRMISERLFDKQKVIEKYGGNYNYENNILGVTILKQIYNEYKGMTYENYEHLQNEEKPYKEKLKYVAFILEMVLSSTYPLIKIDKVEKYLNLIDNFKPENNKGNYNDNNSKHINNGATHLFRGQASVKWNLIPSCLRNIDQRKTYIYDYDALLDQYGKTDVLNLYRTIIDSSSTSYEMVSFFQHAISFSPLIDFTTNIVIATFFALGNHTNINSFYNEDSSVFILSDSNRPDKMSKLEDVDLNRLKIGIYKEGPKTASDYLLMNRNMGRVYGTDATTTISYHRTNDRMRYQSGVFVLFSNYIIDNPNTNVIYNKNFRGSIVKVVIDKSIKKKLLEHLLKTVPELSVKYLMNPYSRFEEA